jgi:hypothetical protein
MAAKKLPAKKMAAPSKPKATTTTTTPPKPKEPKHSFAATLPSTVQRRQIQKEFGNIASDAKTLAEAAKLNQRFRATDKKLNVGGGLINMTYRDKSGKLKNSVMNRAEGSAFPKDDVIYMYNKDKPKGSSTNKAISASMARMAKKKKK